LRFLGTDPDSREDPARPAFPELQSIVENFVDTIRPGHMFGVCAVVLDGKGHAGFACSGKASATQHFTKDTLFQIGSVTKTFTGTLFARRVGENVFDYNDRIAATTTAADCPSKSSGTRFGRAAGWLDAPGGGLVGAKGEYPRRPGQAVTAAVTGSQRPNTCQRVRETGVTRPSSTHRSRTLPSASRIFARCTGLRV
jgi:CubicO group peptidase (beta-lactamase class C family)